jgi:hypothetical protein
MVYLVSSGTDPEKEMNNIFTDFPPPVHFNVERKYFFFLYTFKVISNLVLFSF